MNIIRTTDSTENLCDSCPRHNEIPLCIPDNIEFGNGYGNDNVIACSNCLAKFSDTIYCEEIDKTNSAISKGE